jgi:GNAT superfamily N-acetyltransferase
MMNKPTVVAIEAEQTRPTRQRVLRPHQRPEDIVLPGDDHPLVRHVGAVVDTEIIGVSTVFPGDLNDELGQGQWRLRGMAVVPEWQGHGVGAALVHAGEQHVKHHGGQWLWCYARVKAEGFYQRLGFVSQGELFEIEGIGPHRVMVKKIV